MDIHTFKKSIKIDTHPLHHLKCSFEEGCLAPEVNEIWGRSGYHSRHLLKFTSRFVNKGAVSFRPNLDKSSWEYHTCHEHFHSMETFAVYDLIGEKFSLVLLRDWWISLLLCFDWLTIDFSLFCFRRSMLSAFFKNIYFIFHIVFVKLFFR